jgi:hypothetical protein
MKLFENLEDMGGSIQTVIQQIVEELFNEEIDDDVAKEIANRLSLSELLALDIAYTNGDKDEVKNILGDDIQLEYSMGMAHQVTSSASSRPAPSHKDVQTNAKQAGDSEQANNSYSGSVQSGVTTANSSDSDEEDSPDAVMTDGEEHLDELSPDTLRSYQKKATDDHATAVDDETYHNMAARRADSAGSKGVADHHRGIANKATKRADKRADGWRAANVAYHRVGTAESGTFDPDYRSGQEEINEEVSAKEFDFLKKGDIVTIEYKSAMSTGKSTFKVTAKNVVGKARVEKITLQSIKNPRGVKYFLYKRSTGVTFAQGDMGASVVKFTKKDVQVDELSKKTLGSYVKKATSDSWRKKGHDQAVNKLTKKDEQLDEWLPIIGAIAGGAAQIARVGAQIAPRVLRASPMPSAGMVAGVVDKYWPSWSPAGKSPAGEPPAGNTSPSALSAFRDKQYQSSFSAGRKKDEQLDEFLPIIGAVARAAATTAPRVVPRAVAVAARVLGAGIKKDEDKLVSKDKADYVAHLMSVENTNEVKVRSTNEVVSSTPTGLGGEWMDGGERRAYARQMQKQYKVKVKYQGTHDDPKISFHGKQENVESAVESFYGNRLRQAHRDNEHLFGDDNVISGTSVSMDDIMKRKSFTQRNEQQIDEIVLNKSAKKDLAQEENMQEGPQQDDDFVKVDGLREYGIIMDQLGAEFNYSTQADFADGEMVGYRQEVDRDEYNVWWAYYVKPELAQMIQDDVTNQRDVVNRTLKKLTNEFQATLAGQGHRNENDIIDDMLKIVDANDVKDILNALDNDEPMGETNIIKMVEWLQRRAGIG